MTIIDSHLEEEWETIRTDFDKAFEELYCFQYSLPGINNTFSVRQIDELVLTSGRLIARDPLNFLENSELETGRLNINLPPGRYSILLSVINLQPFGNSDQIAACAMLRLSNQRAVKWKLARCVNGDVFSYGADSGTGCFMDVDAAQLWWQGSLFYEEELEILEILDRYGIELAKPKIQPEGGLIAAMEENVKRGVGDWASIQFRDITEANIVAFGCGGDGVYASWLGYDIKGNLVNIVTDFVERTPIEF